MWDVKGYGPEDAEEDLVRSYIAEAFPDALIVDLLQREDGWWGAQLRHPGDKSDHWKCVRTAPVEDGEYLAIRIEGHPPLTRLRDFQTARR
ncbi:hypothetical protein pthi1_p52 [Paracoccus phage vB_PthS_Pthi1]|uniref:Uncharacterized protein n=1 Tax=Paracoccus thiocyanatus TaxID=34006 RepID=A0A1N6SE12_9RHOB|nr:hypothetical protein [Paracoccus thiocyanatus]AZV00417.1 hypothetical protein pthi1_p52 [Paracoccus phage vB_PthS_Pthi1]RDW14447.1 hypothetical protein DIE28_02780 [Paracoccus thiocyanatus]SIQ39212.1 hypothetical protein SAMN05421641_10771 [Paracoccus thiocyanatus]